MLLSIAKLITLIFVTSVVLCFIYRVWVKHTKPWYKISAILLGAVAVGVCIAQIYISTPIVLFAPLPVLGLIMMVLADLVD